MKISIALPIHRMKHSVYFLSQTFQMFLKQTFKDFEIVISDNSTYHKDYCEASVYKDLNIRYIHNPKIGMAANTNFAIEQCKGELIKILYLDDRLADENSLQQIVDAFTPETKWLITGCDTNLNPVYTGDIHLGNNKLGSPSCLTIRNDKPMLFDEKMSWLLDCDYYKRMYLKYGDPVILPGKHIVMGIGDHQMTNILTSSAKAEEANYMKFKYAQIT